MTNLYLKSGFLNQKYIEAEAKRIGAAFIVELGARQVGKTYGCLQLALEEKEPFILMRRTKDEAKFIANGSLNPFLALGETGVYTKTMTEYTGGIFNSEDEQIGLIMSLNTVAKIRGFYGGTYKKLIYDEFIPEAHVARIRNEGDAFLNAVITISGNRELEGEPPLLTWLLANSNNIASPILSALNLQDKIESMLMKGQEFSVMKERGVVLVLPKSERVLNKRKENALVKAAGDQSKFYQMAYENKFSYNDAEHVGAKALGNYKPVFAVEGRFTVYQRKGMRELYVTQYRKCDKTFPDNSRGYRQMLLCYPELKVIYTAGATYFQNLIVKQIYIDILKV